MRVLIAGCGYLGLALGARLVSLGHEVTGLRRPGSDPGPLRAAGVVPVAADLGRAEEVAALPGAWDWVVHCAAPGEGGEAAYRAVYLDGARNLARRLLREPGVRVVFTGSTSVYGQTDGLPVTEESATEPRAATGRVLLETEACWRREAGAVVLRSAGIYGPDRHRLRALARGEARSTGDGSRWMNLVHRDDLVEAVIAAWTRGVAGEVYNVADDAPPTEREFQAWVCARLRVDLPRSGPGLEPGASDRRPRGATHKRVIARKLRETTGWRPRFPTFREGYGPLIDAWLLGGER